MFRLSLIALLFIFTGCGSDEPVLKPTPPTIIKGDKGDKGSKGDKGDAGQQGIQGEKGEQGNVGPAGQDGQDGVQGSKGDKGDKGEAGSNGMDGADGSKGDQGEKGEKGDKGEQGVQGETGLMGNSAIADVYTIDVDRSLNPLTQYNYVEADGDAVVMMPEAFTVNSQPSKNGSNEWLAFKFGSTTLCYKGKNNTKRYELNYGKALNAQSSCASQLDNSSAVLMSWVNVNKDDKIQIIPETLKFNGVIITVNIPFVGIEE